MNSTHTSANKYPPEESEAIGLPPLNGTAQMRSTQGSVVARAVGAEIISPALQRGVDEANNAFGVP